MNQHCDKTLRQKSADEEMLDEKNPANEQMSWTSEVSYFHKNCII